MSRPEGDDFDPNRVSVGELMSRQVACAQPGQPVAEVVRMLVDSGLSGAPVVDADGKPVGVVSRVDLLRAGSSNSELCARDVMTPLVFFVREHDSVGQAAALMHDEGVHRLAVLGPKAGSTANQVVGLISALDLVSWLAERLAPATS